MSYQLAVTLLHPPWVGSVTDWLRAGLAWPELLLVILVSRGLARLHSRASRSWWLLGLALCSYTIARNLWTLDDQFIHPNHVPFPTLPDLFFILQYPFFFLALVLLPGARPWGPRLKVILDCLLFMGATSALFWYFILAPIYWRSAESLAGKVVNLAYPLGDLCLLFGLTVALIYRRCQVARVVLSLLIVAVACLVAADSGAASLILYPQHVYQTGHPSDVFWLAFYLLVPLAGLVQLRLTRYKLAGSSETCSEAQNCWQIRRQDLREAFQLLLPLGAALLTSAMMAVQAVMTPGHPLQPVAPLLVIFGLLLLALARQGVTVLENAQLRRERAAARSGELAAQASEQSIREANQQLETFLGMASHELKTPLASIILGLQMTQRRLQRLMPALGSSAGEVLPTITGVVGLAETTLKQGGRLNRLVNDLLETSRIEAGQLDLQITSADLMDMVRLAVEEQRQVAPERAIGLHLPAGGAVPVHVDVERIGQVITNYLSNALKYSAEAYPVEVGLEREARHGRVWVRDLGPGLLLEEQERIWERFHRVKGIEVQSGSGIGLGLGLHICRTIIEQHHGQVGVQSAPGAGATFWFIIPLASPDQIP